MFLSKRIISLFIITVLFASYTDFTNAFIEVSKEANPAVVSIISQKEVEVYNPFRSDPFFDDFFPREFFDFPGKGDSYKSPSLGSGVIIDSNNGYIMTNSHVINKSDEIKVVLYDKREYEAQIIGEDPLSDIAIIQISGDNLNEVELGNSNDLQVGQWVIAIGSPFGLHLNHTVTAGIISAVGRTDVMSKMNYENFIQHDAAINPGNSGGALLDLDGNLIGINTAIATDGYSRANVGVGFAVPINQAKRVAQDLINNGTVKRGWLGVSIQDITDEMKIALNLESKKGALVSQILDGSPAEKSGLKIEDIIIKVEDYEINNTSDLRNIISDKYPGKKTTITVIRDNKKKTINVILGQRPDNDSSSSTNQNSNKSTEFDLIGLKIKNTNSEGVKVVEVEPNSSAYRGGIRSGDIIETIGRRIINNDSDYFDMIKKYDKGDTMMLRIVRNGNPTYLAFTIN